MPRYILTQSAVTIQLSSISNLTGRPRKASNGSATPSAAPTR